MDEKKQHIFGAAADVFTRYGFKKASMQDVADAAMMSRAALYIHFRNKDDLFRSLMEWHHARALGVAESAFLSDRPFINRTETALIDFSMAMMAPVRASAHGTELFEANMMLAGDINVRTAARLRSVLEQEIETATGKNELSLKATGLSAEILADLLYTCVDGIKKAPDGLDMLETRLRALMRVIEAATRLT